MLLWDEEMKARLDVIGALSIDRRQRLAVAVLEATLELFRPSFDVLFQPATARFVRDALERCRQRLGGTTTELIGDEAYIKRLFDLAEVDPEPGAYTLMRGISLLVEGFDKLDGDAAYTVLSHCYEAILNSERIPRVTIEAERANDNCRRTLTMQKELVDRA